MENKDCFATPKEADEFSSDQNASFLKIKNNEGIPELNLRTKLNTAFTDLESLRKTIKDIRNNNDHIISRNDLPSNNINKESKHDFFSDERFTKVLKQNKQNKYNNVPLDPSKSNKFLSINNYSSNRENNNTTRERYNNQGNLSTNKTSKDKNNSIRDNYQSYQNLPISNSYLRNNKRIDYSLTNSIADFNYLNHDNKKIESTNPNTSLNNRHQNTSNIFSTNNKYSYMSLREEIERLKISNQILLKNISELKNENKNLNKELEISQKQNSTDKNTHNQSYLNQTPKKISFNINKPENDDESNNKAYSELIESLKASLNLSKQHNQELADLSEFNQKKNSELYKENENLKDQHEILEKDLDNLKNFIEETKLTIDNLKNELAKLESLQIENIQNKQLAEEKLNIAEEQISNLMSINDGHLKTKKDHLEVIDGLRNTIDIIKRGGNHKEENLIELKIKLEEYENTINQKNYIIKNMTDNINNFEKDREFYNSTLNNLKDEIIDKETFTVELEQKYRGLYSELEKSNMKIETLLCKLDEKDQTILNLKSSISFINETMDDYKVDYDIIKNELENEKTEKIKLVKNIELTKEKFGDLTTDIEELQETKKELQKNFLENDKELKEKKNLLTKANFENNSLEQQLKESKNIIEQLKEELKLDKITKLNEEFQNEIAKSNEGRMRKIDELKNELEIKANEMEKLITSHEENIRNKDEKIKELTRLLSKAEKNNYDSEIISNEKSTKFNSAVEELKNEIMNQKINFENEKRNLQFNNEDYLRKINELKIRCLELEEKYNNAVKKINEEVKTNSYTTAPITDNYTSNTNMKIPYENKDVNKITFEGDQNNLGWSHYKAGDIYKTSNLENFNYDPSKFLSNISNYEKPGSYNYGNVNSNVDNFSSIYSNSGLGNYNLSNFNMTSNITGGDGSYNEKKNKDSELDKKKNI